MVRIEWENKKDLSGRILENTQYYQDKFKKIRITSFNSSKNLIKENNTTHWTNKLIWGDNLEVLYYLLNDFKEKIDLIYIDPPFFSGTNYHIEIKSEAREFNAIAYNDYWKNDLDSYLQMLYERMVLFKKLLSKKGLIFVHLDWHASHYIRIILEEIFGQNKFVNNIVWYYYNKYSAGKQNLPRAHDDILVYSKSSSYTFNELRIPRERPKKQLKREMVNGVLKNVKDENGHVVYRLVTDKKMDDVWRIPCMQPASKEWTGFPTQKHHKLLERIIKLGSNEGDLVADFFCGSGTTLLVAEKLKRKWIGCDISEYSIYITRKRLLEFLTKESKNFREHPSFETFTYLTDEHLKIINSGFFEKDIEIRRKK
ncbi:MAG: site-specific DNA-methyltransferase [Promethearchaeota archaeon]|nr:MAG: site-specific DNA-methyltransferase [Candidatus Lokiarchaeota archaeon]